MRLNRRDRAHQVLRWLRATHPTQRHVRLRVESRMPKGYRDCHPAVWLDSSPLIRLDANQTRSSLVYGLLHEWGHIVVYERDPHYEGDDHSDAFYRALGVIERSWLNGGERDSTEF